GTGVLPAGRGPHTGDGASVRCLRFAFVAKRTHTAKTAGKRDRLPKKLYERELFRLQAELVKAQEWVRAEDQRLVVIFEGRDAAGQGSTIKRVTQYLNPPVARIAALPAPTQHARTPRYLQR